MPRSAGRLTPWRRGPSCTRARAASARRRSRPRPRAAAPPPGARTLVVSTDPAHSLADVLERRASAPSPPPSGRPACRPSRSPRRTSSSATGPRCRTGPGDMLVERGVDRITAEELTVPPGADELFALLAHQAPPRERRLRRRRRRLRADRRDAAAALVPRRRALVAGEGLPAAAAGSSTRRARSPARCSTSSSPARRCSPTSQRLVAQPDRDARDPPRPRAGDAAARDDPRPDGRRRGAAHVHLPEPVRLPHRRRRRQPRVPRGRRRLLRRLARAPAGAARARSRRRSRRSRCSARRSSTQEVRGAEMLDRLGDALFAGHDAAAVLHADVRARARRRPRRRALRLALPFAEKGDARAQEDRRRARRPRRRAQADDACCPRPWRGTGRSAPRSSTGSSRSPSMAQTGRPRQPAPHSGTSPPRSPRASTRPPDDPPQPPRRPADRTGSGGSPARPTRAGARDQKPARPAGEPGAGGRRPGDPTRPPGADPPAEPPPPDADPAPPADPQGAGDPLEELRARVRRTQEAAEALAREAMPPGPATGPRPTGAPWYPTTGPAARPPAPDPGATWDAGGAAGGPADRGWTRPRAQEPDGSGVVRGGRARAPGARRARRPPALARPGRAPGPARRARPPAPDRGPGAHRLVPRAPRTTRERARRGRGHPDRLTAREGPATEDRAGRPAPYNRIACQPPSSPPRPGSSPGRPRTTPRPASVASP